MHRFSLLRFSTRFYEFSLHVHHVSVMQVGFGTELIPGTRWRKTEAWRCLPRFTAVRRHSARQICEFPALFGRFRADAVEKLESLASRLRCAVLSLCDTPRVPTVSSFSNLVLSYPSVTPREFPHSLASRLPCSVLSLCDTPRVPTFSSFQTPVFCLIPL
ncbi:hypothetical protein RRG08_045590 [Elysia crispata]|uniref:Uncharacterized protein n=1 Tax=Elysia crispata TaxID=231223 RepID=A0AAE1AEU0_9GAST|nr:hypothetical protein RRG08_045590 [Elysia crispata]